LLQKADKLIAAATGIGETRKRTFSERNSIMPITALSIQERLHAAKPRSIQSELSKRDLASDLVDHYIQTELSDEADWHSHATRIVYSEFLKRWIRPHWPDVAIRDVRTVDVERWLRQLRRVNGEWPEDTTKAKIRNLMSVLCNHAIRYEWLEQGRNPFRIMSQATAALARDSPAQINMTIRNPNTNASLTDSLIALLVVGLRPRGTCKPASLISSA
jgi:hypothetical protein